MIFYHIVMAQTTANKKWIVLSNEFDVPFFRNEEKKQRKKLVRKVTINRDEKLSLVCDVRTYQILKLKLGPQDNSGMTEMNSNGINSPLSVLWRKSNVSGMLSFLKPLQETNGGSERTRAREKEREKITKWHAKVLPSCECLQIKRVREMESYV